MITEDYCSYEVAKLLKEKGFDECCEAYYEDDRFCWVWNDGCSRNTDNPKYVSCPTQALAMKWLREEHNLSIEISSTEATESLRWAAYVYEIGKTDDFVEAYIGTYGTYEDAVEAALEDCLTNKI